VGHWEGIEPDDSPTALTKMLQSWRFQGYARFVNGDIGTAIQRLKHSFVGRFEFDLMLAGGKIGGEVEDDQVFDLISYLSPGGALILSYPSTNDFMRIWNKVRKNYSQCSYFKCADQKTGMVLAAKLKDCDHDQGPQRADILFDTSWFIPLRIYERLNNGCWEEASEMLNSYSGPCDQRLFLLKMCRYMHMRPRRLSGIKMTIQDAFLNI
jgi:hypothetical protein